MNTNTPKMILTPSSFTYEYLNGLKYKEVQKLSAQFHVNRRWAKKQKLIENLLALKIKDETSADNNEDEGNEWKDGSIVFNNIQENTENEVSRRLTFNVNKKSNVEHGDRRLTFEVSQNNKNLLPETVNSRETYDIAPSIIDLNVEPLMESRATFEVPPKEKLVEEIDSRATFDIPQNGKKLLNDIEANVNENLDDEHFRNLKPHEFGKQQVGLNQSVGNTSIKKGKEEKGKLQVKTLTVPYARVTRKTRKDGETSKMDSSIKLSNKSIQIKKSSRLPISRNNLIKSPALSAVKNSVNKQTLIQTLTQDQPEKNKENKVSVQLNFSEVKQSEKANDGNKENIRKILRKRISKTAHEILIKKSNLVKVNFRTPPPAVDRSSKVLPVKKTPLRKDMESRLNKSATPGVLSTTKPITATKMPDFNKIHQRQFQQMDSLHDYLKKKEERIRKLFGTPQPGQQQALNKTPVFRLQSTTVEKDKKGSEALKGTAMSAKKKDESTTAQKAAFKNKLPPLKPRSEIKDKNRSHIQGVRTNKRFQLQMKFRNM